jgi:uncharacterized membrane protein
MGRIAEVDVLRAIAIILMVVYHFFFDLKFLGFVDISLHDTGWILFQRTIGTLFVFLAGASLALSESRHKNYMRHVKRAVKLGAVALLITAATWIWPHEGFIRFGVLHFIALATLIAPLFFRFGWLNVIIGLIIIAAGMEIHYTDIGYLFWLGPIRTDYLPLDHYPLVPWFGIVLIGIYAGQRVYPNGKTRWNIRSPLLEKIGKNSLVVYLLHQPILIGLLMLLKN